MIINQILLIFFYYFFIFLRDFRFLLLKKNRFETEFFSKRVKKYITKSEIL